MTISAHGTRRIYNGATRVREPETSSVPNRTLFDELHPHLRKSEPVQGRNALYEYLKRRGPVRLKQIMQKMSITGKVARSRLRSRPDLYRRTDKGWVVIMKESNE